MAAHFSVMFLQAGSVPVHGTLNVRHCFSFLSLFTADEQNSPCSFSAAMASTFEWIHDNDSFSTDTRHNGVGSAGSPVKVKPTKIQLSH